MQLDEFFKLLMQLDEFKTGVSEHFVIFWTCKHEQISQLH